MVKGLPILAGVSGLGASVEAGLSTVNPGTLEVLGRWPLTVILGAVCVICVYFMYKQSKDNAERNAVINKAITDTFLALSAGERTASEKLFMQNSASTKELAEAHAKVFKELVESHAKETRILLDELTKRKPV